MAKEIILLEDVDGLGIEGDILKVKEGYARNFLVPSGKASPVTALARKQVEARLAKRAERLAAELTGAEELKTRLARVDLEIRMKVSDDGKLYGSVQAADIVKALKAQGVELDKSAIRLREPIKHLGVSEVPIKLHADVSTVIEIRVKKEE